MMTKCRFGIEMRVDSSNALMKIDPKSTYLKEFKQHVLECTKPNSLMITLYVLLLS